LVETAQSEGRLTGAGGLSAQAQNIIDDQIP